MWAAARPNRDYTATVRALFGRGRSWGSWLLPFEGIQRLNEQKDAEGYDQEVQQYRREVAKGQNRAKLFGIGQSKTRGHLLGKRQVDITEIQIPQEPPDGRHDDILNQGGDDLAESSADDYANGKINDVSTQGELFEFFDHGRGPCRHG